jgi:protein tyrosine phosphatase (PTP) superfamily phosphohydrolase (DUF442 family)
MTNTTDLVSQIYNYRSVNERLATGGQPTEGQLAAAARDGFDVVINLALHDDPRYSLTDEAGLVGSLGMQYIHIPVQFDAPGEDELLKFFAAMDQHKNEKILVHCAANMRVSAFLGLYRIIRQHWSNKAAFDLMNSVWEPNAVWYDFITDMVAKQGNL